MLSPGVIRGFFASLGSIEQKLCYIVRHSQDFLSSKQRSKRIMEPLKFENCSCYLYLSEKKDAPAVYIPVFEGHGEDIFKELSKKSHGQLNLVVIADINWAQDMAPFCMNALNANSSHLRGGAASFLSALTEAVIPKAEATFLLHPKYRVLCGYSLAGLFALFALYRCSLFSRIGSFSGSLWVPDFKDFCLQNNLKIKPERIYLSLGDQEKKSSHPLLKSIEEKTKETLSYYRTQGIQCAFELNNGGHDHNVAWRCARGIITLTAKSSRIFSAQ